MLEIGLTGGIGSGKSTVAELLVERGAHLVDADAIVRQVQQPGMAVFDAMVERWGDGILAEDGTLDRQAVADIVFSDEDELTALNGIVHPGVTDEMTRQRKCHVDTDHTVILDIPLLIESGYEGLGGTIVVDVPLDVQVERLVSFRKFSEADARARIASQVSREERLEKADFVIDNSGDLVALKAEIDRCWAWIESLPRPPVGTDPEVIRGRVDAKKKKK